MEEQRFVILARVQIEEVEELRRKLVRRKKLTTLITLRFRQLDHRKVEVIESYPVKNPVKRRGDQHRRRKM